MRTRLSGASRRAPILGGALLCLATAGCSLVSFRSPERPLPARDLEVRILTRELAAQFQAGVARGAQQIASSESDPAVLEHALRWEIAAIAESRRAATRMTPMMSLLDSWALGAQMQAFMQEGAPGAALFGTHLAVVREPTDDFAQDTQALAKRLLSAQEFSGYQQFITQYARQHPLQDLGFVRASVIEQWSREKGSDASLVDSLGTIPQAMADVMDRMEIYSDTEPREVVLRTQLALRAAGYSGDDVQASLKQLDARLERLAVVAETAPQLVHEAEAQVRESLGEVLARLDASSRAATEALHTERAALFADIHTERAALLTAVDAERKALADDAARIAERVVRSSGDEVARVTREALLLLTLLAAVVLGLPFAAGYAMGRARRRE
jgi:hypothetical protein